MLAVLVVAAWAVKPTSAIALIETAWWRSETAALTPPNKMTVESGMAVAAAGGSESRMTATPQKSGK